MFVAPPPSLLCVGGGGGGAGHPQDCMGCGGGCGGVVLGVPWDAGCCGTHRDGDGRGMLRGAELWCGAAVPHTEHMVWGARGGGRGCGVCAAGGAVCPAVGCRACGAAGCSAPPLCAAQHPTPSAHHCHTCPPRGSQRGGCWGCSTVCPPRSPPHPCRPRPRCTALIAMLELMRLAVQVRARCHGTASQMQPRRWGPGWGGPVRLSPPLKTGSSARSAHIPQCPGVGWGLPRAVAS